jgi:hypothetical protein
MDHHHIASLVAIWASVFASMAGAGLAIFAGLWSAQRRGSQSFDAIASARRIRTMPIRAREA